MTNKAQILANGHDDRQSTALSNPGRAMDSRNAVKQGFPAGKCVISTQNQQTKPIKPNLKIPSIPKEREEEKGAGREGKKRSEHLLINRMKQKTSLTQSLSICYKQDNWKSSDFSSCVGGISTIYFRF